MKKFLCVLALLIAIPCYAGDVEWIVTWDLIENYLISCKEYESIVDEFGIKSNEMGNFTVACWDTRTQHKRKVFDTEEDARAFYKRGRQAEEPQTFADGTVWAKRGNRYGGGLGTRFRLPDDWGGNEIEAWLTIYAKEHDTPNMCQDNTLDVRMQIWGPVYGLIQVTYGTWDQGGERWSGWGETVGAGVKF